MVIFQRWGRVNVVIRISGDLSNSFVNDGLCSIRFCLGSVSSCLFFGGLLFCSSLFSRELLCCSLFLSDLRFSIGLGISFVLSDLAIDLRLNFFRAVSEYAFRAVDAGVD